MPPWTLGWSVFSRPCIISGKAGVVGHVADEDALAFEVLAGTAGAENLHAGRCQSTGEVGQPLLIADTDQRTLNTGRFHSVVGRGDELICSIVTRSVSEERIFEASLTLALTMSSSETTHCSLLREHGQPPRWPPIDNLCMLTLPHRLVSLEHVRGFGVRALQRQSRGDGYRFPLFQHWRARRGVPFTGSESNEAGLSPPPLIPYPTGIPKSLMAKKRLEFTEILVRRGVVSPDQIREAAQMSKETGAKVGDALVRLGYATGEDVSRAIAEQHGLNYVSLGEVAIPPSVIELVPESVARENAVLPLSESDGRLTVVLSDPMDLDTVDKLKFILNKQVDLSLAPREAILEAINRYYGQTIAESADQMLTEFTDTAIDFTETVDDGPKGDESVDEASAPDRAAMPIDHPEAVQSRASDIHIEPFENRIRVRYRIDGQLDRTR